MRMIRRRPSLVLLLALGVSASACSKKPTEAQCDEFAEHFVKLLEESRDKPDARIRKLARDMRQDVVDSCVEHGTKEEVECVLAQTSIGDVEANCKAQ